jgi:hypothetical protein
MYAKGEQVPVSGALRSRARTSVDHAPAAPTGAFYPPPPPPGYPAR